MEYAYRLPNTTRIVVSNLQGSFNDHLTGEEIRFHSTDHFPSDSNVGIKEYWELQGEDGQTYRLLGSGEIQDEVGQTVGEFDPHVDPDPDRHEDEPSAYDWNGDTGDDWDMDHRTTKTANDDIAELYTDQEKKALTCDNCGSHSLRAFDVEGGEAEVKCLTCGNTFKRKVFKNPESKVAMEADDNPGGPMVKLVSDVLARMGYQSDIDPELNNEIYSYVKDITNGSLATASNEVGGYQQLVEAIVKSMEQPNTMPGEPGYIDTQMDRTPGDTYPSDVGVPAGSEEYYRGAGYMEPFMGRWQNQKRAADGAGKYSPGSRIKMNHPTFKGQKGSILEFKDRHDDLGEESYKILLDSGLEVDDCPESHFDKHKSARVVSNVGLPDSTQNFFLESMTFEAGPGDDFEYDHRDDPAIDQFSDPNLQAEHDEHYPTENAQCPMCEGPGGELGSLGSKKWFRCQNCGMDFSQRDDGVISPIRNFTGSKQADKAPPGAWPTADRPKNPNGLPEESGDVKNNTPEDYDPKATDPRYDEPDLSGGETECPLCHASASSKGAFGPREYFGCGSCGMEFSYPNSDESAKWGVDDPDQLFGQDGPSKMGSGWDPRQPTPQYSPTPGITNTYQMGDQNLMNRPLDNQLPTACPQCGQLTLKNGVCTQCGYVAPALAPPQDPTGAQGRISSVRDSIGNELKAGNWYILHSSEYKVPDVIKIVELNDGRIVAHFETDHNGSFPLQIESSQTDKYSFDPYDYHKDPEVIDEKAIQSESGWQTTARRNFSQREQQDLINENLDGRARNFEKLNLDGTHYHVHSSLVDDNFLWQ